MAQKRNRGLGRGLGALIQNTSTVEDEDQPTKPDASDDNKQIDSSEASSPTNVAERYAESSGQKKPGRPSDLFFSGGSFSSTKGGKKTRAEMPNPLVSRETKQQDPEVAEAHALEHGEIAPGAISVEDISPNPQQPREYFDEDELRELVTSISEVGVLQPIVVRHSPDADTTYELVMGERRWRAAQRAGLSEIPAIVRETSDEELLREALLENIHRSELNPLEEAAAYEQLMKDFGWSQEMLSKRIGRSRPHISNTLRLMRLPAVLHPRIASGVISAGHARALLGLDDTSMLSSVADRVVNEGLSVRATEELVNLYNNGGTKRTCRVASQDSSRFEDLATSFGDELDTKVRITLGARKGKIAIDFASPEDLNRIMDIIRPQSRN